MCLCISQSLIVFLSLISNFNNRIEYTPLVATSSTLSNSGELKNILCQLGGHLVGEWKEKCDYVVMDKVSLTIKVVCCVLSGKRIVLPSFFQDYLSAVEAKKTSYPKPHNYFPPISAAEAALCTLDCSFQPNPRRKTLFQGKLFLFDTHKNMKKLGIAIKCGGGETGLITTVPQSTLKNKNTLIVGMDDQFKQSSEEVQTAVRK